MDFKLWFLFLKTKSLWFSLMLQSLNSKTKSKLTNFQLKLVLELSHQLITLYQLDLQDLIPLKLTSSMLLTSQPKLTKVKSKSLKTSRSVLRIRKSKLQKLLFLRNSIWNHLHMVWESLECMMMEQSYQKKLSISILHHLLANSKMVLETLPDFLFHLDTLSKQQCLSSLLIVSGISQLFPSNQGKPLSYYRFNIPEVANLGSGGSEPPK